MNGRRNSNLVFPGLHKLQKGHLGSGILHRYPVGSEIHIITPSYKVLDLLGIVEMSVKNFLGQTHGPADLLPYNFELGGDVAVVILDKIEIECHCI